MLLKYDIFISPPEFFFSIRTVACTMARHHRKPGKVAEQRLTSQHVKWLRRIVANFGPLFRD
jgi:hypothetical protein